jgi:uncharacterized SAM-binding protein YcdF (DUF218 family)
MLGAVPLDALVVLGCRVQGGELRAAARRRVERAALAYHEQGARWVVASGGKRWDGFVECEVFARGLIALGIPPERVLLERQSLTTRGNARGVARLLGAPAPLELGLVTCDWHLPRARRLFERAGFVPIPIAAPSPPPAAHVRLWRRLRERGSLAIDLTLAPLWLRP